MSVPHGVHIEDDLFVGPDAASARAARDRACPDRVRFVAPSAWATKRAARQAVAHAVEHLRDRTTLVTDHTSRVDLRALAAVGVEVLVGGQQPTLENADVKPFAAPAGSFPSMRLDQHWRNALSGDSFSAGDSFQIRSGSADQ